MLAAGIDDRIRRDLLGHRLDRDRYGKGASLDQSSLTGSVAFDCLAAAPPDLLP